MTQKALDFYMTLPYTVEVIKDSGAEYSGLFARVVELPGCMTQADTYAELGEMIEDAKRGWIEAALESGQDIPEPRPEEKYSGKFIVRVPRSLHQELVEAAKREGVSLNLFVNTALGKAIGQVKSESRKEYPPSYQQLKSKRMVNEKSDPIR
jgi:antitoxin HicB